MSDEDLKIWDSVLARVLTGNSVAAAASWFVLAKHGDSRDFKLMLFAQRIASCGPSAFELYGIPCRGWTVGVLSPQRFRDLFDTLE